MRRQLSKALQTGFLAVLLLAPSAASANWTLNLGYHNPVYAHYGVNFLYLGSQWGFELGIGWLDLRTSDTDDKDKNDKDDDTASSAVGGDINVKYFFKSGGLRPYAQIGVGSSVGLSAGKKTGGGADVGGGFVGLGVLAGSPAFYGYLSGNLVGNNFVGQGGIGFDI